MFANDEREAPVDRAVAAASLRLIAVPEAREGLVTLLGAPEPIVRVEAVKALGCIGDEAALSSAGAAPRRVARGASWPSRRR